MKDEGGTQMFLEAADSLNYGLKLFTWVAHTFDKTVQFMVTVVTHIRPTVHTISEGALSLLLLLYPLA